MTFTEWLNSLGQVVNSFVIWIGDTFNALKDNYIIMTILGISLFYFLFSIVSKIINSAHTKNLDKYDNKKKEY